MGALVKLDPVSFLHVSACLLRIFLFSGTVRCSKLTFDIYCHRPDDSFHLGARLRMRQRFGEKADKGGRKGDLALANILREFFFFFFF